MSNLQLFTGLPTEKNQRKDFVQACVDEFLSGELNPLQVEVAIKNLEDIVKAIRSNDDVRSYVMDEAVKHGKKFDFGGAEIAVSSRTTSDFTVCGDAIYNDLIAQHEQLKKVIKAREEMLKAGINPETGETFTPPKTNTTEFLTIRFK